MLAHVPPRRGLSTCDCVGEGRRQGDVCARVRSEHVDRGD